MQVKGRWHVTGRLITLIGGLVLVLAQFMGAPLMAADPIKVGWVGPLTPPGGYAEGALMKKAAGLAAEEIDAEGGVRGRPRPSMFTMTRGPPAPSHLSGHPWPARGGHGGRRTAHFPRARGGDYRRVPQLGVPRGDGSRPQRGYPDHCGGRVGPQDHCQRLSRGVPSRTQPS